MGKHRIKHNVNGHHCPRCIGGALIRDLHDPKVCLNCGYLFMGVDFNMNPCTFCGSSLSDGNTKEVFVHLLELSETRTKEMERITCEEEERLSRGYEIKTLFHVPGGKQSIITTKIKNDNEDFLNVQFIPAASLVQINKKWRATREEGFLIGLKSGDSDRRWRSS